jgi:chromosome segregation ATPase
MFALAMLEDLVTTLHRIDRRLGAIESGIALLKNQGDKAMSAVDDLAKQVEANTTIEQSAITLIQGLSAQLSAAATDPAKVTALASQLSSSATALAAAIAANTPAAPAPAPAS